MSSSNSPARPNQSSVTTAIQSACAIVDWDSPNPHYVPAIPLPCAASASARPPVRWHEGPLYALGRASRAETKIRVSSPLMCISALWDTLHQNTIQSQDDSEWLTGPRDT